MVYNKRENQDRAYEDRIGAEQGEAHRKVFPFWMSFLEAQRAGEQR